MQVARFLPLVLAIATLQSNLPLASQPIAKTVINDRTATRQLIGKHKLSLQWIGWDKWSDFGNARVVDRDGTLFIKGRQAKDENFLEIDGRIVSIEQKEFVFQGRIITQIDHINGGKSCERNGTMTFKITGTRKYWRLQEMQSPCDTTTDYVDIFMR